MKRRIVMATWGSLGDLHPFLAVALGLKTRGHHVTIASAADYREKVEAEELEFYPLRPELAPLVADPALMRRLGDLRYGTEYLVREVILRHLPEAYKDLASACREADVLVGHNFVFACPIVAEKLGIPWLSVALQPMAFFSSNDSPVIPGTPWLTCFRQLGWIPRSMMIRSIKRATRHWMTPIDDLRKTLGLPSPVGHPLFDGGFSERGTLAWFSRVVGPPQPDWPPHVTVTGFPFYDGEAPPMEASARLAEFLAQGEPPVAFTLGSAAVHVAGDFYDESLATVRRLGCRAVFLVGKDPRNRPYAPVSENVFVTDYAPHAKVFPRAAVVAHQGGIGTAAQALRAGRPMLVVPYGMDQPDNAVRLFRLGVARVLPRRRYRARRAAREISKLMTDDRYREAACQAARSLRAEDAVQTTCEVIERL